MSKYLDLFNKGQTITTMGGGLSDEFGTPPFSVFDTRQGYWQARKAAWLARGIKSEVGRGENLLKFSDTVLQPDPSKRMKNGKARAATSESGRPGDLQKTFRAIPGSGVGEKSVWKFKTEDGYKTNAEQEHAVRDKTRAIGTGAWVRQKIAEGDISGGLAANISGNGTSIFDPVLCELFYRWFVPLDGWILDPFAGGSVRGVMASLLGFNYVGMDLREEQIAANVAQGEALCTPERQPLWVTLDSRNLNEVCEPESVDSIWSCPPYFDLEQYSDDPLDLSNMKYSEFLDVYDEIIGKAAACLKPDRFAGWVIGEVRDKSDGTLRGLVPETIRLFEKHGLRLYNDAVLLTAIGSLSIRIGRQFRVSRKLGRTHQYVLIFVKGDPRKAAEAINHE